MDGFLGFSFTISDSGRAGMTGEKAACKGWTAFPVQKNPDTLGRLRRHNKKAYSS
jgi:hypothetical protein